MNRIFLVFCFLTTISAAPSNSKRENIGSQTNVDALYLNNYVYSIIGGEHNILITTHELFPNIITVSTIDTLSSAAKKVLFLDEGDGFLVL